MPQDEYTKEEVLSALKSVKNRIEQGVDIVIGEGKIMTHKTERAGIATGLEAIVANNPEVRIDTLALEIFAFANGDLISINY
jgi:hypothetical protein